MTYSIMESWKLEGTDLAELREALAALKKATAIFQTRLDKISLITLKEDPMVKNGDLPDSVTALITEGDSGRQKLVTVDLRPLKQASPDICREALNGCRTMAIVGGKLTFISENLFTTLNQRIRLAGKFGGPLLRDFPERRFRDGLISNRCARSDSMVTVLQKSCGGPVKTYAAFGGRYEMVPQLDVLDAVLENFRKSLGETTLERFVVDNFYTEALLAFPEKAKEVAHVYNKVTYKDQLVPCVLLCMSDTGDSSIILQGGFIHKDARKKSTFVMSIPEMREACMHTMNSSAQKIVEKAEKKIFAAVEYIPRKMTELSGVDIPGKYAGKILERVIYDAPLSLGTTKMLGKERCANVYAQLQGLFDPSGEYTAYDIATAVMEIPEIINLDTIWEDHQSAHNVRTRLAQVLDIDFAKKLADVETKAC